MKAVCTEQLGCNPSPPDDSLQPRGRGRGEGFGGGTVRCETRRQFQSFASGVVATILALSFFSRYGNELRKTCTRFDALRRTVQIRFSRVQETQKTPQHVILA